MKRRSAAIVVGIIGIVGVIAGIVTYKKNCDDNF